MSNQFLNCLTGLSAAVMLAACGGGGGGGNSEEAQTDPNAQSLSGTIAIPTSTATTMAAVSRSSAGQLFMAQETTMECPNIPMGYDPLSNASVVFLDDNGNTIGNGATTDMCGDFSASAPGATAVVEVTSTGTRDISVPVTQFTASSPTGGLASTIPSTSTYEIGSLTLVDNDTVSFTVVDSATGTAVIGLPPSAFSAALNAAPIGVTNTSANANAATSQAASVGLVLDASGSMSGSVLDANSGLFFSRFELASLASHQFLDQKAASDETSVTIFDNTIDFIDDANIADLFTLNDGNGMPTTYTFAADGFTTDSSDLRFVVDAYVPTSQLYNLGFGVVPHPDTPALDITSGHPWGGSTAFFSATDEALTRVAARPAPRKIIIAMTDGGDNASSISDSQLIDNANAANIPIFTIGFGSGSNEFILEQIADQTGGDFFLAEGTDITAAFQSIGTNVQFFYTADLDQMVAAPFDLTLNLDFNGVMDSRNLVQN